ncbi:MAG: hypothetical protein ACYDFT_02215 [Thermoplasmata archaeon]
MPLLAADSSLPDEVVVAILRNHRSSIQALSEPMRSSESSGDAPYRFATAIDLGQESLGLLTLAEAPGAPRELRIATANLSAAVLLAMVDLFKTHAGLPQVPGRRPNGPVPASGTDTA